MEPCFFSSTTESDWPTFRRMIRACSSSCILTVFFNEDSLDLSEPVEDTTGEEDGIGLFPSMSGLLLSTVTVFLRLFFLNPSMPESRTPRPAPPVAGGGGSPPGGGGGGAPPLITGGGGGALARGGGGAALAGGGGGGGWAVEARCGADVGGAAGNVGGSCGECGGGGGG